MTIGAINLFFFQVFASTTEDNSVCQFILNIVQKGVIRTEFFVYWHGTTHHNHTFKKKIHSKIPFLLSINYLFRCINIISLFKILTANVICAQNVRLS